ncbi:MAG TPA: DUF1800 domain-containing protein [Verrucomicrobiae bacterium]|nr:DUF1800 domain-containing protein [Verrucomicrobiae bacterium]
MQIDVAGMLRPAGALDPDPLAPYRGALDERSAAHLLRRAGFGGTPDDVRRYAAMSVGDAVESLVRFPSETVAPPDVYDPTPVLAQYGPAGLRALSRHDRFEVLHTTQIESEKSVRAITLWWLDRMIAGPAPLQERMTLAYHGHFTTAAIGKYVSAKNVFDQNQLFRSYALGNLRELTRAVSKDPAMLLYLDNGVNTAAHPNENYARELMELFTLGVDHYTEDDVRESARAWTGWRYDRFSGEVRFVPRFHDDGVKTFLGRTGNLDGDDVVDTIFAQPQCARFFAAWLLNAFVYNDPESALVDGVAAMLRKHDYELAPVVSAILRSNVFYSPRAYRALVKSPVEFVVGAYRTLGLPEAEPRTVLALRTMGQWLFYPPNVAGWAGGGNWLTSDTMIARQNFLSGIVNSRNVERSAWLGSLPMQPQSASRALASGILQDDASPATLAQIGAFLEGAGSSALGALSPENFAERASGAAYLALASPAFQLS